ncbi:hypothetical protein [Roseiconus lacunae]|uniref:hypothetical protein n=1 Tax=Roseiconus lacunae TaxID=2605694 RepID=UPI0011F2F8D9|nr:hypothetical protein [Roseiconus lacunae]MCD0460220.1 hypothetical protein [Roseiconus lacunae]WRQ53590.1 hypothetical protein U8335_13945 [Stieleria sp. HD01]
MIEFLSQRRFAAQICVVVLSPLAIVLIGLSRHATAVDPPKSLPDVTELPAKVDGYQPRIVQGWGFQISERLLDEDRQQTEHAVMKFADQIELVKRILPPGSLKQISHVTIWLSPPYEGFGATGEYHPSARWLQANGRAPELHRCIEFTNTAKIDAEIKRMPALLLHELAHAYHDQVLGFEHPEIERVFRQARDAGTYDAVARHDGKITKSYAMTNAKEYFAELSESLFARNDFFPFDHGELVRHDPQGYRVLTRLWNQ